MDASNSKGQISRSSDQNESNFDKSSQDIAKTKSGPTVVFLWMWNWLIALPKTVTNLYADIKSGELLSRFTLLDAMLQFIVAVATSCHPQEESMSEEEHKPNNDISSSMKTQQDKPVFGGTGRTLRSRIVETNS